MAIKTEFWEDGTLKMEIHHVDGQPTKLHREDGPAMIMYYRGSGIASFAWYRNGHLFRRGGPAETFYVSFGIVVKEVWYEKEGVGPHREDGPAMIEYSVSTGRIDNMVWYWNGRWLAIHNQHQFEKYVQERYIEEVMEG